MKRFYARMRMAAFRSPVKLTIYRVADQGWRAGWNRYYAGTARQQTIGAGIVLGTHSVSLKWRAAR